MPYSECPALFAGDPARALGHSMMLIVQLQGQNYYYCSYYLLGTVALAAKLGASTTVLYCRSHLVDSSVPKKKQENVLTYSQYAITIFTPKLALVAQKGTKLKVCTRAQVALCSVTSQSS
jgi:hypothetical protein